jgi:hypothetical protein
MVDINPADDVPARAGAPSPPGPAFFWSGTNRIRDVAGDARLHRRPREYDGGLFADVCCRQPVRKVPRVSRRIQVPDGPEHGPASVASAARPGQHASGIRAVEVIIALSRCCALALSGS